MIVNVAEKMGAIIIPMIGLTVVLYRLGYNVTAMLATLGFMGMVIGLAAKPIIIQLLRRHGDHGWTGPTSPGT